jgi:diaminopimelate epimerase
LVKGLKFWKMHGTGNDYIIIDNRDENLREDNNIMSFARQVCQRRFSVGADGLLLVYNSDIADVKMRMFNPDGTEAEMCGNGIRCFVKFCYENKIVRKKKLYVETLAGIKQTQLLTSDGEVKSVKVNMGKPSFNRSSIPMLGKGTCINEKLKVDGETYTVTCLSLGNPHCVLFADDVEAFSVQQIGSKIETYNIFPKRINVEFVQIVNREEIKVRVWERGVGETLACGTGACASAVVCYVLGKTDRKVTVHLLGGDLKISYNNCVLMRGPTIKVFAGELSLN